MKKIFRITCSAVLILFFSLSFASDAKTEKKINVEVALDGVSQQENISSVKFAGTGEPLQMTIMVTTTRGDSVNTQVRDITINAQDEELDLEKILEELNLEMGAAGGETKCFIKLSGNTDELEDLDLDLEGLDMDGNIMIIELDDDSYTEDNCPMHDNQAMKNGMNHPDSACRSKAIFKNFLKGRRDTGESEFFYVEDGQDDDDAACKMQMRSGMTSADCCKERPGRKHGQAGFSWFSDDGSSRGRGFQYGMQKPGGPGCGAMGEGSEKCSESPCNGEACGSGGMGGHMGQMPGRPFAGRPMGGIGVDLNILDFDFAGINSFITAFGFTPIDNNGASFVGMRLQHAIGRGWFLGGMGAGYATTQNIKGTDYSRHLSIQSGYGGATLTRRYPLRPFLLFEGSLMLGGGNTDIEISDVRENPTFDNPSSNFGNIDHLKFERLFFVYRPEASLIMKINPLLGIRAAVSYLGTYGGDWKTVPFGYTVEGNSPDVPDGTNFSLGLWIGR